MNFKSQQATVNDMREKARQVIENEISYFVGQSQKRTDSTIEVLKSLSELENAEASKPTIQLPKVAHLNVDFEPLLMQAQVRVIKGFYVLYRYSFVFVCNPVPALRLETRFQKPEPRTESKMTKLKPHHRLELNDVFQKEIQFHFKLDVSDI